jgi:complement component 1 Q subcomponent-binding protein
MEEDMKEDDDLSANIKEYLENSPFEVSTISLHMHQHISSTPHSLRTRPVTKKLP